MKVNLECGTDLRNGYVNINSMPIPIGELPENTHFVAGPYNNLDPIIKEPVEEIIFNPFLNRITPDALVQVFEHWTSKLADGGTLKVSFLDIKRIAKDIHTGEMEISGIHNAIFGPQNDHKSIIFTSMMKSIAKEFKLDIEHITIKDMFVTMEMKKNGIKD